MNLRLLTKCWKNYRLPLLLLKRVNQVQIRRIQVSRKLSSENDDEDTFQASKALLYPFSTDPVINKIKKCSSLEELTNFLEKSSNEIATKEHICQLIVMLSGFACDTGLIIVSPIVSRLNEFTSTMTSNELTSCYFYLNKLGVKIRHPTMEKITDEIVPRISRIDKGEEFDSQCLMKFTYVLSSDKCLYTSVLSSSALPMVFRELENCKTSENLYAIATSINNISHIVSTDLLNLFKMKVVELLDKDRVTDPKCIFKIINFLNYPHWSFKNHQLIRRLLLELEFNFDSMDTRNLSTVNRAFQSQLESAKVVPMVVKRAQKLMEETPSVELLALAALNVTPNHRMKTAGMARHFLSNYQIKSTDSGEVLQTLFKIVRLLKISDINMCDTYWTKALNEIYSTKESSITYRLSRHIHKYMFFNNNLGGTYRHQEFEKSMIDMLMKEMKVVVIPKDFAMFAAFIIAYGDGSDRLEIPDFIIGKIEQLHGQFTIKDCLMLSRGMQIMQEMRAKNQVSLDLEEQIGEVNKVLGLCAKRHMKMENLHLTEMNSVIRAYIIRKAPRDTHMFHKMIKFYQKSKHDDLNSRTIRESAFNMTACNFRIDGMCDQFIDYILENWEHVTGDTVEKILSCCYNFSYFPEKHEVFDRSSEIIIRDFNFMQGISIVQALLALVFYKSCPHQLIAMVFSAEFIKRLEQEITMCYSLTTYPQRVMNQVMQLNRAVCLDCPEVNVKWFQQSFIEAQASKMPLVKGKAQAEVKNLLMSIVGSQDFLGINNVTPYGYRIDFELYVDHYNRFVRAPEDYLNVNFNPNVNKIAILLLSNKVFCDNDIHRLRGSELLRMRHLEMMGYRVIHVKINDLNALYKNVKAKIKYLKNLLQLTA